MSASKYAGLYAGGGFVSALGAAVPGLCAVAGGSSLYCGVRLKMSQRGR